VLVVQQFAQSSSNHYGRRQFCDTPKIIQLALAGHQLTTNTNTVLLMLTRDVVLGTCTRVVLEYKSRVLVLILVLEYSYSYLKGE